MRRLLPSRDGERRDPVRHEADRPERDFKRAEAEPRATTCDLKVIYVVSYADIGIAYRIYKKRYRGLPVRARLVKLGKIRGTVSAPMRDRFSPKPGTVSALSRDRFSPEDFKKTSCARDRFSPSSWK